jgi:hypothetical protein
MSQMIKELGNLLNNCIKYKTLNALNVLNAYLNESHTRCHITSNVVIIDQMTEQTKQLLFVLTVSDCITDECDAKCGITCVDMFCIIGFSKQMIEMLSKRLITVNTDFMSFE